MSFLGNSKNRNPAPEENFKIGTDMSLVALKTVPVPANTAAPTLLVNRNGIGKNRYNINR